MLLDLRVYPRMSIFLESESDGTFVVDAGLSRVVGDEYCLGAWREGFITDGGHAGAAVLTEDLTVTISNANGGENIVTASVKLNSTGNQVPFSLSAFTPRFDPYDVVVWTQAPCGSTHTARTSFRRLPLRSDGGSVSRVDNLYGGLMVLSEDDEATSWKPILPFSFYVDWGNYLSRSPANVASFAKLGYNIIHPTPGGGNEPWDFDAFMSFVDQLEQLGMFLMYDMRWTFKNLSSVAEQVDRLRARKSMLLWYTGDEPDGWGDALNSTVLSYQKIQALDPYHPVSLVLNCQNFHYADYAAGADIVLADPYPIGVNMSVSVQWGTACNETYGDCGCDNCAGSLDDIGERLDDLQRYQTWLRAPPKPFWGVPQAHGGAEYWARPPTAAEEVVMDAMFLNHGAKGLVAWNFPTTEEIKEVSSALAKVVTAEETTAFFLGTKPERLVVEGPGSDGFDATGWRVGEQMLVSIVNKAYKAVEGVSVSIGDKGVKSIRGVWTEGEATGWTAQGKRIRKDAVAELEVSMVMLDLG